LFFCLLLAALIFMTACGDSGSSVTTGGTTEPPTGNVSPNPGTSAAADSFMATIFTINPDGSTPSPIPSPLGSVTVDATANDGRGNLQASGGAANSNYELDFCGTGPTTTANCVRITTYTTDTSGNAQVNFQVPASASASLGSTSGIFSGALIVFKDGVARFGSGEHTGAAGTSFRAVLLPSAGTSGHGAVSVSGQVVHFTVTGAKPNAGFQAMDCGVGAGCGPTTTFTTDAQGNGTVDLQLPSRATVSFYRVVGADTSYQSGFRVQ
jgi:hypothetical protein